MIAAECYHCILAAEFVLYQSWRDSKDATAVAIPRQLHCLWLNGKKEESKGRRDFLLCCAASHRDMVNKIVILKAYDCSL